eukprot:TRINITY_DN5743_c0_g1_i1.p1 TRINITY_DN5743_c0_g1~~TRINITY_DN5743_c0_g1_i1.p1  ORF type:complete len:728 (+),score=204.46 TRINITY_DN5743_c0_g1_i1:41-2185(+)
MAESAPPAAVVFDDEAGAGDGVPAGDASSPAATGLSRIFAWFGDRVMLADDDAAARTRKLAVGATAAAGLVFATINLVQEAARGEVRGMELYWLWLPLCWAHALGALLHLFATREVSSMCLKMHLVAMVVWSALCDVHQASWLAPSAGPLFMIALGILAAGRLSSGFTIALLAAVVAWQCVMYAEQLSRYGLFDLWGTATPAQRRGVCECAAPPCAVPAAAGTRSWLMLLCGIVGNFWAMRAFVTGRDRAAQTVLIAAAVADALAAFELDRAAELLDAHGGAMPAEAYAPLAALLANLGISRPYLPRGLFDDFDGEAKVEPSPLCAIGDASLPVSDASGIRPQLSVAMLSGAHSYGSPTTHGSEGTPPSSGEPFRPRVPSARRQSIRSLVSTSSTLTLTSPQFGRAALQLGAVSPHGRGLGSTRLRQQLIEAGVSVLHVSVVWRNAAEASRAEFVKRHTRLVTAVVEAVGARRGVVDGFEGDAVRASFNVAKKTFCHADNAVASAKTCLAELDSAVAVCTAAVASGPALVGHLGTAEVKRSVILGPLLHHAASLARYACVQQHAAVCNAAVAKDAAVTHALKLLCDTAVFDVGDPAPQQVYEVQLGDDHVHVDQEWMYSLESSPARQWDSYNAAAQAVLAGAPAAEAAEKHGLPEELTAVLMRDAAAAVTVDFRPSILHDKRGEGGRTLSLRLSGLEASQLPAWSPLASPFDSP